MRVLLLLAATFLLSDVVLGALELMCPPSLPISSPLYTELTSGPRTIMFRDVYQSGDGGTWPGWFRISVVTRTQRCVLLDRIPYSEGALMTKNYTITVMIPDFECRRQQGCSLMVESGGTVGNRTIAPIYIRSTTGNKPFVCPDSSGTNNWPYMPSPIYRASLIGQGTNARATVDAVVVGSSLSVRVNFDTPFGSDSGGPGIMRLLAAMGDSGNWETLLSVATPQNNGTFQIVTFTLSARTISWLLNGRLIVEIAPLNRGSSAIRGSITRTAETAMDVPYKMTASYSPEGWLASDLYVGPYARASSFVKPFGSCINTTRYFGSPLWTTQDGMTTGGTAGLQLTENRAWFSVDMYNLTSPVVTIELRGQATASVDLTMFWTSGAHIDGVVFVSEEMRRRILAGLSSVWIATETNRGGELIGEFEEAMTSFLESGLEVPPLTVPSNGTGTAVVYVTASGDVAFHITLNNLTSALTNAHLHGTAYQGDTSDVMFDMTPFITQQAGPSSWLISATWRNVTAAQLMYLRVGVYYLNIHTLDVPSGELRGQVTVLGDWMCPREGTVIDQCYWSRLQPLDGVSNNGIRPSAEAAVIIDRVLTLQYSVSLWYLLALPAGNLYTVTLQNRQGAVVHTTTVSLNPTSYSSNAWMVDAFKVDLTQQELQWAHDGMLVLNVTSSNAPSGYLTASVPLLRRNPCPQQRYVTDVGGSEGWNEDVIYPDYYVKVLVGDSVRFTFTAPNNVYLFDNKNRYDGCVFTSGNAPTATLLARSPPNNATMRNYVYTFNQSGMYYFGSSENCQNDPPMKIAYNATAAVSNLASDSYCSRSLYAVTTHRFVSLRDSLVVAGVLIGVVVGVVIVAAAVVLTLVLKLRQNKRGYDINEKGGRGAGEIAVGEKY